jgi:predicted outer membrane protein
VKHATARALSTLVAVAGIAAATFAVSAQTAPPAPGAMRSGPGWMRMPTTNDAEFVRSLAAVNTAELDQARYIVSLTKDAMVHQFAQRMVNDYSIVAVKLNAATRGTNLRPAPGDDSSVPRAGARVLTMLQNESGTQRDNDYMRVEVPADRRARSHCCSGNRRTARART